MDVTVVKTLDELKAYLEEKDWNVEDISFGNDVTGWEIGQYSPAGEDFSFAIEHDKDVETAIQNIKEYAYDFDIEEHVKMWLNAKDSVSGVPDVVTLVEDAKDIQEMLNDIADNVSFSPIMSIGEQIKAAEEKKAAEKETSNEVTINEPER